MIPEDVGSAVQGLLGADRFIGIAHVIEGRLYGTSVLAMKSGTPDPPPELLEVSAHTVAVSLRRWLSENALRESEERFRKLFEAGPLGMAVSDMQYRFTDTNAMFCSILGYSADELGRLTFRDITHPEDIGRDVENIRRLDAGELPAYRTEKRYVRKDGRVVWGSVTVSLLHDSAGRAMHHLVMIEDITDRRRLEDSMRGSEQRYRSLVDNTTEGILLTAPDGRIFSANPPACRMLGRTEEEIIRLGRDGVVDRSDPRLEQGLETRARTGKFKGELTLVRSDGTKFPAEVSTAVFEQAGGERRTVMIISDISKRKSIEEALRASEEKFRRLFETSPEGVVLLDTEGAIIDVNDAGLELNCWTRDGVAGRPFQDLGGFTDDDKARFSDMLRRLNAGEQLDPLEMRVCVKGEERWMEIFMALLLKENEVHTIQVIMKDITERKRAHLEMRARLMKYKLEEGNIYMVTESAPVRSVEAFKDLLMAGYRGVMVTRTPHPDLSIGAAGQFEHLWLSEKGGPGSLGPRLENIGSWFENLPRNQAVLVDRLDYLISKNGCSRTLHFVHGLRELAYLRGHTIIISLDPATVGARLQRSLEKEALPIEPRSVPALPPDELEVLGHVFRQNLAAARSSFTELGRALGLSKPTARKKVRELVRRGYLTMSPRGRTKVLELTEQGRRIFSK